VSVTVAVAVAGGNDGFSAAVGPMVGSSASVAGHESTPCFDNHFQLNENDCHEI